MKRKSSDFILYGSAFLAAVLSVALVYGYVQSRVAEAEKHAKTEVKTVTVVKKPELRSVVVAAHDIFRGEKIDVEDIKVLSVPTEGVVAKGVITNPQEVVGRVAKQNIYAGEWLMNQKVGMQGKEEKSIEAILAPGQRAMRIPVSAETGLLGILNPNDRVDVVSVFDEGNKTVSRAILQNIEVLSIGQYNRMGRNDTQAKPQSQPTPEENEAFVKSSMVTLNVDTKQAEMLALAMNVGAVHLLLRNPADVKIVPTKGVNVKILNRGFSKIKYKVKKRKREVIEIMQGGQVQRVITQ